MRPLALAASKSFRIPAARAAVRNPDLRVMETLMGLASYHRKTYCFPTQAKLCELVKRITGRTMSRRTLNRHLAGLERQGFVRRTRRHQAHRTHGFVMRSTLYRIGARYLARVRNIVAGVAKFSRAANDLIASSRVPQAAQYARNLLKVLVPRGTYPQPQAAPPG